MNCPSCGAPMRLCPDLDSLRCDYCQSVYIPDQGDDGVRVLGESVEDVCPLGHGNLVHAAIVKIRILYCTQCRGMLVPMQIIESLVDELRSVGSGTVEQRPADPRDLGRAIPCPHCRKKMEAHFYAGPGNVVIDSCEDCGVIWLDRGELMKMARAPDHLQPEPIFETALGDDDPTGSARWLDPFGD